MMKKTG